MEQVPFSYWLHPEAPGAYVDLSAEGGASMEDAQRWWVGSGIAAVGLVCTVCAFAWWHKCRLGRIFRAEADSLDEDRIAPQLTLEAQLTLEQSYETTTKEGMKAHREYLGSYTRQ